MACKMLDKVTVLVDLVDGLRVVLVPTEIREHFTCYGEYSPKDLYKHACWPYRGNSYMVSAFLANGYRLATEAERVDAINKTLKKELP